MHPLLLTQLLSVFALVFRELELVDVCRAVVVPPLLDVVVVVSPRQDAAVVSLPSAWPLDEEKVDR